MATEPEEPHFQVEGVLRTFFGDHAAPEALSEALRTTARTAREMLDELGGYAAEYLTPGGPMDMLDAGIGGEGSREEFGGRTMYPERLPAVALTLDVTTELLAVLDRFFGEAGAEVGTWPAGPDDRVLRRTRARLEAARSR